MGDSFAPWVTRVRKDPLGPRGFNSLLEGFRWVENLYGEEHIHSTGEHNAAEIPREVGSVEIVAGLAGAITGFRYAISATWTVTGTIQLRTDGDQYSDVGQMAVQVTNCSETGLTKPCITSYQIIDTGRVDFFSKSLTSALAAPGNAWAAGDAHFVAALHGVPKAPGAIAFEAGLVTRGTTLKDDTLSWNAHVAADQGLRSDFLVEHSSSGVHTNREVAQGWAYVIWDGASLTSTSGGRNPVVTTTHVGTGIYELEFTNAWTLPAQPFVSVDYARNNGGDPGEIWVCCCPRSQITTTKVRYYLYKYTPGSPGQWDRGDTDLFTVVHAGD